MRAMYTSPLNVPPWLVELAFCVGYLYVMPLSLSNGFVAIAPCLMIVADTHGYPFHLALQRSCRGGPSLLYTPPRSLGPPTFPERLDYAYFACDLFAGLEAAVGRTVPSTQIPVARREIASASWVNVLLGLHALLRTGGPHGNNGYE